MCAITIEVTTGIGKYSDQYDSELVVWSRFFSRSTLGVT